MAESLDLSAMIKASTSFEQSLEVFQRYCTSSSDMGLRKTLQAGVIQNFEFTYELCWKFMKRWLGNNLGRNEVEGVSRRALFRLAHESRLIDGVDIWMTFHAARNQTSHTYEQSTADEVLTIAKDFLPHALSLLSRLQAKMINLDQRSKGIIEELLEPYIATGSLYVFGSRVAGDTHSHSDLDLLIRSEEALPFVDFLAIKDALEFSDLPIRVDLLDWQRITPEFRKNIEQKCELWK